KITGGQTLNLREERPVLHLLTDSRKLMVNAGAVFFATAGVRHDGHLYLQEIYNKGVRQFVVEKPVETASMPEANILLVEKSIVALQKIAAFHRKKVDLTVVAITGSNGKTIVKEWLSQMLAAKL